MLAIRTLGGAAWLASSRLAGRLVDFVTLLVLARVLSPADFGLIAIAATLISAVDVILEIPLTQALTRLHLIRKSHLDTAFTLGILRSLLLTSVVLASAWPFSAIYDDNRLTLIIVVLAVGPISRGLYSPGMIKYVRDIDFRRIFLTEIAGKISASSLAMLVLYFGGDYWAIVVNSIVASIVATVISYVLAPYRPAFTLANVSEFSSFIGWFSVAQLVAALNWQFDRVLLGRYVDKSTFGQYTIASDLALLPIQSLTGPTTQPLMAALSKMAGERERLQNAYLKASRFIMMLAAPVFVGLSLTSDLFIDILFDAKWAEAAVYLQWLALTLVLAPYPLHSLALAVSRPDMILRLNIIDLSCRVVLVSFGLYLGSISGVIAARGAISLILFASSLVAAKNLAGISIPSQLSNLWRIAVACAVMSIGVLAVRYHIKFIEINLFMEMLLTSICGALVYGGALYALGFRLIPIHRW